MTTAVNSSSSRLSLIQNEIKLFSSLVLTNVVGAVALNIIFGSHVRPVGGVVSGVSAYLTNSLLLRVGTGQTDYKGEIGHKLFKTCCKSVLLILILEQFAQNPANPDNIPTVLFNKEEKSVLKELKNSFSSATRKEDVEAIIKPSLEKTSAEFQDAFRAFFKTEGLLNLAYENQKNPDTTKPIPKSLISKFKENLNVNQKNATLILFFLTALIAHKTFLAILSPIAAISLCKSTVIMAAGQIVTLLTLPRNKPREGLTQAG